MTLNSEIKACLMQNFMKFDMKNFLDPKAVTFRVWDLKN